MFDFRKDLKEANPDDIGNMVNSSHVVIEQTKKLLNGRYNLEIYIKEYDPTSQKFNDRDNPVKTANSKSALDMAKQYAEDQNLKIYIKLHDGAGNEKIFVPKNS